MPFQSEFGTIRWKMHLASSRVRVFDALSTDEGRARFWAESAPETEGEIAFTFLNHKPVSGRVLATQFPSMFKVEYFGSVVTFVLEEDGAGGTDLTLVATGVDESSRGEVTAGWVSVLMALKAGVDFGVDLRNHDSTRTWGDGYADN